MPRKEKAPYKPSDILSNEEQDIFLKCRPGKETNVIILRQMIHLPDCMSCSVLGLKICSSKYRQLVCAREIKIINTALLTGVSIY